MKVRTEARREAIVKEATRLFLEMGYVRATMGELTQRMGGSKATLYGYFKSKEDLFAAVVEANGEAHLAEAMVELEQLPTVGLESGLKRFAEKLLSLMLKEDAMALYRMILSEAGHSNVGEVFAELGPRRCTEALCAAFRDAMERGDMERGPEAVLSMHYMALVRSEIEFLMYQRKPLRPSRKEIEAMARRAVSVFLRGYTALCQDAGAKSSA